MVVLLFSAEQYRLGLKDVMPGWNNFQAKCHKMFKPLGKGRSKHHFFIALPCVKYFGGNLMAEKITIYGKAG